MDLYVGNATRMNFVHNYRIPEVGLRHLQIASGRQEIIKNLTQAQYDFVLNDLVTRFGAKTPLELNKSHSSLKRFDGFIVSDKVISEHALHYGWEEHKEYAQDRAVMESNKTALSMDRDQKGKRKAKETTLEVEEEGGSKKDKKMRSSITISEDGPSQADINLE